MSDRYIKLSTARSYLREACMSIGSNGGRMLTARFDNEPTIEIIQCKDCVKHNVSVEDWYDDRWKQVCPLVGYRGKAEGHEYDYQFCAFAERRTE